MTTKWMQVLCLIMLPNLLGADNLHYTKEWLYNCNDDDDYDSNKRLQILTLYPIDAYVFVIVGPISLLACLFIIGVFIKYPTSRKTPGDILLGLSICDLFNTIHLISSGIYYFHDDKQAPDEDSLFCQTNGIASTLTIQGDFLYNLAFVLSPLILVSNTLSSKPIYKSFIHVGIVLVCMGGTTYAIVTKRINLNLAGLCTYAAARRGDQFSSTYFYSIYLLLYISLAIFVYIRFRRAVPNLEQFREYKLKYLYIYKRFVITTVLLWTVQDVLGILNNTNCYFIQEPKLNVTLTLYNTISIITPIIQCYIRSQDPILRSKINKLFVSKTLKTTSVDLEVSLQTHRTDIREYSQPTFLQSIQLQLRTTQVYSMLAGILMMLRDQQQSKLRCERATMDMELEGSNSTMDERIRRLEATIKEMEEYEKKGTYQNSNFTKAQCEEKATVIMTENTLMDAFPYEHEYSVFNTRITFYAPEVFKYFLDKDQCMIDLMQSLDLLKNRDRISTFGGPDGGKSGEFFFFSWDNKIIIKTMQTAEVVALRKRMYLYGNYLFNNPDSMIAKLYGVFTFQRLADNQIVDEAIPTTHFLVMRNISLGVPREYILRTFDMKGSEFDREVLAKKRNADISKLTLKDLDFFKTEKKIYIRSQMADLMLESLIQDAQFFREGRLIDYSLLVFKVDWGSYFQKTGKTFKEIRLQISNPLYMVESIKEPGIYYHVGIIDYLQEWNVNKSAEQLTKKIIQLNHNLDTSAQNPEVYASRFQKKLIERILTITPDDVKFCEQGQ